VLLLVLFNLGQQISQNKKEGQKNLSWQHFSLNGTSFDRDPQKFFFFSLRHFKKLLSQVFIQKSYSSTSFPILLCAGRILLQHIFSSKYVVTSGLGILSIRLCPTIPFLYKFLHMLEMQYIRPIRANAYSSSLQYCVLNLFSLMVEKNV